MKRDEQLIRELAETPDEQFQKNYPGETRETVYCYIRLTHLIPQLLATVDAGVVDIVTGAILSFISEANQNALWRYFITDHNVRIGADLAEELQQADDAQMIFNDATLPLLVQNFENKKEE